MKAVVLTGAGGPETLELRDIDKPVLARETDVLVRIKAAGVNPVDTKMRAKADGYPLRLPTVLGCDGAGIVEAVGAAVTRFKPGDEVYYCQAPLDARLGNYAEFAAVDSRLLAPKPKRLSFAEAAAVPLVIITAWEALHDRAKLDKDQTVLIHAGSGGVGHVAVQLARLAGARVATTVGSPTKVEFVRGLGAELPILYKQQNFVEAVAAWTGGRGVDLAFDTVGGKTFEQTFGAVRYYGDLVTLLQPGPEVDWTVARTRNLRIGYELMLSPWFAGLEPALVHQSEILREAARLIDAGKLQVRVQESFPLARAADAHRRIAKGDLTGKLVLTMD